MAEQFILATAIFFYNMKTDSLPYPKVSPKRSCLTGNSHQRTKWESCARAFLLERTENVGPDPGSAVVLGPEVDICLCRQKNKKQPKLRTAASFCFCPEPLDEITTTSTQSTKKVFISLKSLPLCGVDYYYFEDPLN